MWLPFAGCAHSAPGWPGRVSRPEIIERQVDLVEVRYLGDITHAIDPPEIIMEKIIGWVASYPLDTSSFFFRRQETTQTY